MKSLDTSEIRWSHKAVNSRELIANFSHSFPVFVLVSKGYYGSQELERLAVDQVVRISHWVSQKRVLARDSRGRYLSFPLDHPIKFRKVKKKKRGTTPNQVALTSENFTLSKLIERHVSPMKVHFDQDHKWIFKIGDQEYTNVDFGTLEIQKQYTEPFLIGNAIHNGIIDDKAILVPLYLDIHWKVAEGFKSNNGEDWISFQQMYTNAVSHIRFKSITGSADVLLYPDENADTARNESWPGTSSISDVSRVPGSMGSDLGSSVASNKIQPNWTLVLNVDKNTATLRRDGTSSGADEPIKVSLMQNGMTADSNIGQMSTTSGIVSSSDHASRIEIKTNKRRGSISSSSSKSTEISTEREPLTRNKSNVVRIRMKDKSRRGRHGEFLVDESMNYSRPRRHHSYGHGDREEYWEPPQYRHRTHSNDDYIESGQYTGSLIVGSSHRRSRGRSRTRRSEENKIRAESMDRTRYDRGIYSEQTMDDSVFYSLNRPQYASERSVYDTHGSQFGMRVLDENRRVSSTGDIRVVPVNRPYLKRSPRLRRKSPQRSELLLKQGKLVEDYDAYGGYTKYSWDEMQNRIHDGTMPIGLSGAGLQWSSSQTKSLTRNKSPEQQLMERRRMQSGGSDPNLARDYTSNKMKKIISPYGTLFVSTDDKEVSGNLRSPVRGDPSPTYKSLGAPMSDFGFYTKNEDNFKVSHYQDIKSRKAVPIVKDDNGGTEYKGTLTISDKMGQVPRLTFDEGDRSPGQQSDKRMEAPMTTVQHTFEAFSTLERKKYNQPDQQISDKVSDYATVPLKKKSTNYVYSVDLDNIPKVTTEAKSEESKVAKRTTTIISHDMPAEDIENEDASLEAPEDPQDLQQSDSSAFVQIPNGQIPTKEPTKQRDFSKSPVINVLTPVKNKPVAEQQHSQQSTQMNSSSVIEQASVTETIKTEHTVESNEITNRTGSHADSVFESTAKSSEIVLPRPPSSPPPPLILENEDANIPPAISDSSNKYSRVRVKKKSKAGRIDIRSNEDSSVNVSSLREAYKKRSPLHVDGSTGEISDRTSNRSGHSSQIHALDELNTYLRDQADIDTQSEKSVVESNSYNVTTAWKI